MTAHPFILNILQQVTAERLQRAVAAISDNTLSVTLTRTSGVEIRALVKNSTGSEYGVTLTPALSTCSCKDALYRGETCKHQTTVALFALRTPQARHEQPQLKTPPQFPMFHLQWRSGVILCGAHHPARVQTYPWTEYMLTWSEVCSECTTAYKHPGALNKAA